MKPKKYIITFLLIAGALIGKAQTIQQAINDTTVFTAVEHPAEFPGGDGKLKSTINKLVRYPADARMKNIQGKIPVGFIIEKDGSLTHIKVYRSLSPDTDAEAIRVVSSLPKWKPGMQSGKVIRLNYMVVVPFYLAN